MNSQLASDRAAAYELLLHALNHEQTRDNYDRHVLVLEKWCRETTGGLFISDLKYAVEVLQILRERVSLHPEMFTSALMMLLKNCSQPLRESKANERMRPAGLESIKALYAELSRLWIDGSIQVRIAVTRCFRCIVNGGRDPDILKADYVEWKSDGQTAQVTDIPFIFSLIRESGTLGSVVNEFHRAVNETSIEKSGFLKATTTLSKFQSRKRDSMAKDEDSDDDMDLVIDDNTNNNNNSNNEKDENRLSTPLSANNESELIADVGMRKNELSVFQELTHLLLDLCLRLSEDNKNASTMCTMCIFDSLVALLKDAAEESPREPRVSICIEVMWNCLESYLNQSVMPGLQSYPDITSVDIMDFEIAITVLRDVFLLLLMEGYRLSDKEVRNEVVIILTMIASFPAAIPYFLQSGLFNAIITYACAGEAGRDAWPYFTLPLAKFRNFSSAFDVDIHLKRELWMLISDIMKHDDPDVILCLASSPLLSVMLSYLEQNSLGVQGTQGGGADNMVDTGLGSLASPDGRSTFNDIQGNEEESRQFGTTNKDEPSLIKTAAPAQLRELQALAITFLADNAHRLMGEFLRVEGPSRILDVILKYGKSNLPTYKCLIFHSLLLLNRCLMNSKAVKTKLEEEQAIQVCLMQFEDNEDESIRAQAARLISIMCVESEESQQQLRKVKGISCLVQLLSKYSESRRPLIENKANGSQPKTKPIDAGSADEKGGDADGDISLLVVAVLDCLSNAVVGNRKNEARFAQVEGVDALLDVIEVAPLLIRVQALRLLSDLLNNYRLVAFAMAWRSAKTMRSAGQLLAHAWTDEEERLGSERNNGVICNIWDPLGQHRWPVGKAPSMTAFDNNSLSSFSSSLSTGGASITQSTVVAKLANAISYTRNNTAAGPFSEIYSSAQSLDIRGIIANTLSMLGLLDGIGGTETSPERKLRVQSTIEDDASSDTDSKLLKSESSNAAKHDETLTPYDLQVISMAARYGVLREGQWWRSICEELHVEGIVPIEADGYLLAKKLENHFDAAKFVQFEQMELVSVYNNMKKSEEEVFIGQILKQKNQEIKQEYIKRKAQNNKTHVATKVKL